MVEVVTLTRPPVRHPEAVEAAVEAEVMVVETAAEAEAAAEAEVVILAHRPAHRQALENLPRHRGRMTIRTASATFRMWIFPTVEAKYFCCAAAPLPRRP